MGLHNGVSRHILNGTSSKNILKKLAIMFWLWLCQLEVLLLMPSKIRGKRLQVRIHRLTTLRELEIALQDSPRIRIIQLMPHTAQ